MANAVAFPLLPWIGICSCPPLDLGPGIGGSGSVKESRLDIGTQLRSLRVAFLVFLPFSPHCPKVSLPNRSIFLWICKDDHGFGELLPACEVIVHTLTGSKS